MNVLFLLIGHTLFQYANIRGFVDGPSAALRLELLVYAAIIAECSEKACHIVD